MPFHKGHFGPSAGKPVGKPMAKPMEKKGIGAGGAQPMHEKSPMKHVTETHPGMTKPHPVTGVHAVMHMHKGGSEHHGGGGGMHGGHEGGGGGYTSHVHHDGGEVETKDNQSAQDMNNTDAEAFPDDQSDGMHDQDNQSDKMGSQFADDMADGVGGSMQS